jgi:plasmid stabilization system protein ParE
MPPLEFLIDARRDFDSSFDWYAERSSQVAVRFAAAIDAALARIAANPVQFASCDGVHRQCPVKRFPYRVVYRLIDHQILVVAIAHAKRRPGYWHSRQKPVNPDG